jgi:predicted RNA-binding protein YlxR (DUF448 family)
MKMKSSSSQRTRHVPQRTCLGCRQIKSKRELIRIVNTPEGNLEVDITGRKSGRGAYLCPTSHCWEAGLKENRLDHALHINLGQTGRAQLMKYAEGHLKGDSSASGEKAG